MRVNGIAIAVAAIVVAGAVGVVATAKPGRLTVDEAHFLKIELQGRNLTLDALLFLSSRGGDSKDARIVAFVYPQNTGIASDRQEVEVGLFKSDRTREIRVPIRIQGFNESQPGLWGIDFLVFEDGLLTLKGHGTIGFRQPISIDGPFDLARGIEAQAPNFVQTG